MEQHTLSKELIAAQIKKYRKARGLTQTELGALLGKQKQFIAKLEGGNNNTTLKTLTEVFLALGVVVRISYE